MILEVAIGTALFVFIIAFLCEYVDSTLGMGYGTTLTPLLLIMGFRPMQIVPVVLLSELISGILAAVFHHIVGNVDLKPKTFDVPLVFRKLKELGYLETVSSTVPRHLQIALLLAICSIVGTIVAVFVAVNIPKFWLKMYIGVLVLAMGVVILILFKKQLTFSWSKITFLGILASFNKGMSGGGYGPVVTGGQILSGIESKSAIGITSLAEGLTCLVGVITYVLVAKSPIDWRLAPFVCIGAVLSVPLSAISVKKVTATKLKIAIAVITIVLGFYTIANTLKLF